MKAFAPALIAGLFASATAFAQSAIVEPVTMTSEDKFPVARWMYGQGEAPKGSSIAALLAQVKSAQFNDDFDGCLKGIEAVRAKAKSLQAWLSMNELDCALKLKVGVANAADKISHAIDRIEKNPAWLVKGPQSSLLRGALVRGYLALLDHDAKSNRGRAWRSIESLQELIPFMDDRAKAKMWRSASEIAFLQQKPEAAREFIRRSLAEVDSEELRLRLSAIDSAIGPSASAPSGLQGKAADSKAANVNLEVSKEELELVERVTSALKSGDLVPAVTDAARIIRNFPGGTRAKWAADRIQETIVSLGDKTDPKYAFLREQMLKQLDGLDGERLGDWARAMYNRGQFEEAHQLAKKSLATLGGARSTAILDLGAKAALATERYDVALEMFNELVLRHAGTTASREALYRAGLLHYRMNQHAQAVANFEKLVALPSSDAVEVIGRYWLWRSLQKMKSDNAPAVAEELIRRFPFSYYGLRARLEKSSGSIDWRPEQKKVESKVWLTGRERVTWEKIQLLLKAGWLEEAQAELRELPAPVRAEDKAVRSLLMAAAGSFAPASKLANEAWDEKSDLRRSPFVEAAFPGDFEAYVAAQAETRKLERHLVRGLIKQESSFNLKATSSANAVGLMQMIPGTAKEIAADLKLGPLNLPEDMYQPSRNIQMGTYYLSRMVSKFQGHVPLALAAYNAGPARIERWLRARPSLKDLAKSRSSAPDDEMWIDELPYWETCFYVKAILRNLLIYRLLDQGRVESPNPLWQPQEAITTKP